MLMMSTTEAPPAVAGTALEALPNLTTYPSDVLDGVKDGLSNMEQANFYHWANKYNSNYSPHPSDMQIATFYIKMKQFKKTVQVHAKDVTSEVAIKWAKDRNIRLQPSNQWPANLKDVITALTAGEVAKERYNNTDHILKQRLFEVQFSLYGKTFWQIEEAKLCLESHIVLQNTNPTKEGSVARTMSEAKTWVAKQFQASCDQQFGSHVASCNHAHNAGQIVETIDAGKSVI